MGAFPVPVSPNIFTFLLIHAYLSYEKVALAKPRKPTQMNPTDAERSAKSPTSFAGAAQVPGPRAVAHVAVPAFPAHAVVLTGVAQALLGRLLGARGLDPSRLLDLGQAADVLALPIDEKIPDAAHIAIVEQRRPHLGGEHHAQLVLW